MALEIYTYGTDTTVTALDASWNLPAFGVKLLDTSGYNQRQQIAILLGSKLRARVGLQCEHDLHRSVEMAT